MLGAFRENPALFEGRYISKTIEPEPPSKVMRLGTLLHHAAATVDFELEAGGVFGIEAVVRKHFSDVIKVVEVGSRNAKGFRTAVAASETPDLVCTRPYAETVIGALTSLMKAETPMAALAKWLLIDCPGEREYSHRWKHPSGETCKVRFDALPNAGEGLPGVEHCFVDLKFVNSTDLGIFARNSANFGRHCQGALYSLGYVNLRPAEEGGDPTWPLVVYVIIGNEPPHPIMVAYLSESFIEIGLDEVICNLNDLAECRKSEEWHLPAELSEELPELEPPDWLLKQHDRRING